MKLLFKSKPPQIIWEYKVVQMISQSQVSPDEISRKLGGSLSAESLKAQFPEYYSEQNGRAQICDFLNDLVWCSDKASGWSPLLHENAQEIVTRKY